MSKDARNEDLDPTPEVQAKFNELVALPAAQTLVPDRRVV